MTRAPRIRDLAFDDVQYLWHAEGPVIEMPSASWPVAEGFAVWGHLRTRVGQLDAGYYHLLVHPFDDAILFSAPGRVRADAFRSPFVRRIGVIGWSVDRATADAMVAGP